jgi:hypothetical protein
MFCIDLWGFSIDPPYFGYNFVEHEIPVLCIFTFQGPSRTQIERGFLWHQFLPEKQLEMKKHARGPPRPK